MPGKIETGRQAVKNNERRSVLNNHTAQIIPLPRRVADPFAAFGKEIKAGSSAFFPFEPDESRVKVFPLHGLGAAANRSWGGGGAAARFLAAYFASATQAVQLVSYANDKTQADRFPPREIYIDPGSPKAAEIIGNFVAKYDVAGRAIYFCVSTVRKGERRNKANTAELIGLHADLDFKGIAAERAEIEAVIYKLQLPPRYLNFSGHGLHLFYPFASPLLATSENIAWAEDMMRRLADILAGDLAVCEVARVMRLPGTHNTKHGEWTECVIVKEDESAIYAPQDLENWLLSFQEPLLKRLGAKTKEKQVEPDDFFADYGQQHHGGERLDIDGRLNDLRDGNVHAPTRDVIASQLSRGMQIDELQTWLHEEVRKRMLAQGANWGPYWRNPQADPRNSWFRSSVLEWLKKHPERIELQIDSPDWVKNNPAIKAKLKERQQQQQQQQQEPLEWESMADIRRQPVVPRVWVVENFILAGEVNGLFGDGAIGKDLLLLQLAIAMVSNRQWLGHDVMQGRVLYFNVEDKSQETRRREEKITAAYDVDKTAIWDNLRVVSMRGKDTLLAMVDRGSGLIKPRPLFEKVRRLIEEFRPALVIVGNRVNIFSVSQNDDTQARQCMNLLYELCLKFDTAIIMPGHVSLASKASGEGASGTVQWSAACRLRMYLSYDPDNDTQAGDTVRILEVKKTNYSKPNQTIKMDWEDGVLVPIGGYQAASDAPEGAPNDAARAKERVAAEEESKRRDDQEFLRLLDKYNQRGVNISPAPRGSHNGAATMFSKDDTIQTVLKGDKGKKRLNAAMDRLFEKNIIRSVEIKGRGYITHRIERAGLRLVEDE